MIRDNIKYIFGQIEAVCQRVGRDPGEITLIGVTKYADVPLIQEAIQAGLTHFGENKVQEAKKKFSCLEVADAPLTRHMIGHLQTNKVKTALGVFDLIQSVDSLKLAETIEHEGAKLNKVANILIQVNTAGEEQKFGMAPQEVAALVESVSRFTHIHLMGLMTIAPWTEDKDIVRQCFRDLRLMRDQISERFGGFSSVDMTYLSMGMTDDFEIALEEGSNMIRIGRAIFQ